jgi:hypothetical protein
MLSHIIDDIFQRKYRNDLSLEQYISCIEKGMSILEAKDIRQNDELQNLKALNMALEYREAIMLNLLVTRS